MSDEPNTKPSLSQLAQTTDHYYSIKTTGLREVLRLWPDGKSQCKSEDDLLEAAMVFWRSAKADGSGGVEISFERSGFRINGDNVVECFGGYQPDEKTRQILEMIASLRPSPTKQETPR